MSEEVKKELEDLKNEIKKELEEFKTKSNSWENRLLGVLESSTKGKTPLVTGFKDKTTIVPLARLQNWVENQINILNQQIKQSIQGMYPVFQNLNKQIVDLKAMLLTLDIKSESLQRLSNISLKDLEETMSCVIKEREIEVEIEQDKKANRKVVERPSKDGDVVKIDFVGTIDGKQFKGGKSSNVHLKLGSKTMINGFEEQIVGMKAGDVKDVTVIFPEDYGNKELEGKEAIFSVTVNSVKEEMKNLQEENNSGEKNKEETTKDK